LMAVWFGLSRLTAHHHHPVIIPFCRRFGGLYRHG
jgi:hypothetical protein